MFRAVIERALNADAVRIAPGQQGRARSRADRLRNIKIGKPRALLRRSVVIERFVTAGSEAANVGVAEFIGEDDHKVGRAPGVLATLSQADDSGAGAYETQ